MAFNLHDRRALVVGGSSGIGLGTAHALAGAGARVTIASRSPEKVTAALTELGGDVDGRTLDITQLASVETFFADAGTFDDIVVCGASTSSGPVRSLSMDAAQASMDSKFWGAYRIARTASFSANGSLTLVSGIFAVRPVKGYSLQGAINAALETLTRGLALELAPVRVNCVSPGVIDTPVYAGRRQMLDAVAETLPLGIVGSPDHVAMQILATVANGFMTGSVCYVDGGGIVR